MAALTPSSLADWTPVRVYTGTGEPVVEWALIDEPLCDPFFETTADRAMRRPFNELFARRTAMSAVEALEECGGGIAPAGFVFHMSRCGSTLVSQMLARLRSAVVLSEPQPIDALLRLRRRMTGAEEERTLAAWLRAMVGALGRPHAGEQHLFVKFHAWHVLELPFIARAFPGVPWVFVFREPRAVLRSQAREPGAELVAGTIDPGYVGIAADAAHLVSPDEYGARVLAAFCDAALHGASIGTGAFVDYASLPDAVISQLLPLFGVSPGDDAARMRDVTERDSKRPGTVFDARASVAHTSPEIERLAVRWLDAPYAALRAAAGTRV